MIQLDVYQIGGIIFGSAIAYEVYQQWKIGHDLSEYCKDEICEYMHNKGYDVRIGRFNQPYFVKEQKIYQYKEVRQLLNENRLNEIC